MAAIFAPDTNFFLQCKTPDQIDWSLVTSDKEIVLVLVKEVRRELDRHKSGGNERRAKRARKVASQLRPISVGSVDRIEVTPAESRVRVWLTRAPRIDHSREKPAQLDLSAADERIVEEAYAISIAHYNGELALLSHDSIPLESAQDVGLKAIAIPDEWLLEPELNEQADQLRRLTQRVSLLEGKSPSVRVELLGNESKIEADFQYFPPLDATFVQKALDAAQKANPKKKMSNPEAHPLIKPEIVDTFYRTFGPSEEQWIRYDDDYEKWLQQLKKRLDHAHIILSLSEMGVPARWKISNKGSSSAERLILDVEARGNIRFDNFKECEASKPLELPKPPSAPVSKIFGTSVDFDFASIHRPEAPRLFRGEDRHEFYWNFSPEGMADHCRGRCEEFRHGLQEETFSLYLRASKPSHEIAAGSIRILVSAANLPEATEHVVPVRIKPVTQDTENLVRSWILRDLGIRI